MGAIQGFNFENFKNAVSRKLGENFEGKVNETFKV